MKKELKTLAAIGFCAMSMLAVNMTASSPVVLADAKSQVQQGVNSTGLSGGPTLEGTVKTVINTMLYIVGILAVVMIIYSGIRYITAHGDKGQVESAKNTLIYSIVGLVIAIVAYAIVNFVIGIF